MNQRPSSLIPLLALCLASAALPARAQEPAPSPPPAPAPSVGEKPPEKPPAAQPRPVPGKIATPPKSQALTAPPPAEVCPRWTLNGYRIGMTLDEASAVRPLAPAKDEHQRLVQNDTLDGTLTFDAENRLVRWDAIYPGADAEAVRTAALEKLGVPRKTDTAGQLRKVRRKYWRFYSTIWQKPDCDTRMVLEIGKYLAKKPKDNLSSVHVVLSPPPDSERKDEFKKKQGSAYLE